MRQNRIPPWRMFILFLLIVIALFINIWAMTHSKAEEEELTECWILCQPDSFVNARSRPSSRSAEVGRLECGDKVFTDGKVKKGFLHCYANTETSDCWVHNGYIVYSEPYLPILKDTFVISNGRVAARVTINGKRRCWLKDGQKIKVYMISEIWSVTNKGFVKTEFIEQGHQ